MKIQVSKKVTSAGIAVLFLASSFGIHLSPAFAEAPATPPGLDTAAGKVPEKGLEGVNKAKEAVGVHRPPADELYAGPLSVPESASDKGAEKSAEGKAKAEANKEKAAAHKAEAQAKHDEASQNSQGADKNKRKNAIVKLSAKNQTKNKGIPKALTQLTKPKPH